MPRALRQVIQAELVRREYCTKDDSKFAESVELMYRKKQSKESIDAKLTARIGPEYDSSFTDWLWRKAEALAAGVGEHDAPGSGTGAVLPPAFASSSLPTSNQSSASRPSEKTGQVSRVQQMTAARVTAEGAPAQNEHSLMTPPHMLGARELARAADLAPPSRSEQQQSTSSGARQRASPDGALLAIPPFQESASARAQTGRREGNGKEPSSADSEESTDLDDHEFEDIEPLGSPQQLLGSTPVNDIDEEQLTDALFRVTGPAITAFGLLDEPCKTVADMSAFLKGLNVQDHQLRPLLRLVEAGAGLWVSDPLSLLKEAFPIAAEPGRSRSGVVYMRIMKMDKVDLLHAIDAYIDARQQSSHDKSRQSQDHLNRMKLGMSAKRAEVSSCDGSTVWISYVGLTVNTLQHRLRADSDVNTALVKSFQVFLHQHYAVKMQLTAVPVLAFEGLKDRKKLYLGERLLTFLFPLHRTTNSQIGGVCWGPKPGPKPIGYQEPPTRIPELPMDEDLVGINSDLEPLTAQNRGIVFALRGSQSQVSSRAATYAQSSTPTRLLGRTPSIEFESPSWLQLSDKCDDDSVIAACLRVVRGQDDVEDRQVWKEAAEEARTLMNQLKKSHIIIVPTRQSILALIALITQKQVDADSFRLYENGELSKTTAFDAMSIKCNGPWMIFQFDYQGTSHFAIPIIGRTGYARGVDREQKVNAEGVIALAIAQRLAAASASTAITAIRDERMKAVLAKSKKLLAARQRSSTLLNRSEVLAMNHIKELQWHEIRPKPARGRDTTRAEIFKVFRNANDFTTVRIQRSSLPGGELAHGWVSPIWDPEEERIKFAYRQATAPKSVSYVGDAISLRRCIGRTFSRNKIFIDMLLDESLITQEDVDRLTCPSPGTVWNTKGREMPIITHHSLENPSQTPLAEARYEHTRHALVISAVASNGPLQVQGAFMITSGFCEELTRELDETWCVSLQVQAGTLCVYAHAASFEDDVAPMPVYDPTPILLAAVPAVFAQVMTFRDIKRMKQAFFADLLRSHIKQHHPLYLIPDSDPRWALTTVNNNYIRKSVSDTLKMNVNATKRFRDVVEGRQAKRRKLEHPALTVQEHDLPDLTLYMSPATMREVRYASGRQQHYTFPPPLPLSFLTEVLPSAAQRRSGSGSLGSKQNQVSICVDNAVVIDPERAENVITNDGVTMRILAQKMKKASVWRQMKEYVNNGELATTSSEPNENERPTGDGVPGSNLFQ
ncbi:unnamed protein product [Tilletia controversa]|nr:unnamed protein product [Tilletia controversa]